MSPFFDKRTVGALLIASLGLACTDNTPVVFTPPPDPVQEPSLSPQKATQVLDRRQGATLLASSPYHPSAAVSFTALRRFVLNTGSQTLDLGVALSGLLLPPGAVLVRSDRTLVYTDGKQDRILDREVQTDLALLDQALFYVRGSDTTAEVLRLNWKTSSSQRVAGPFLHADRLAVAGAQLVLVGTTQASDLPGLFVVDQPLASNPAVRRLTNEGLRSGRGLPPTFIPPPLRASSVQSQGNAIVYCDGEHGWRVALDSGQAVEDLQGCAKEGVR